MVGRAPSLAGRYGTVRRRVKNAVVTILAAILLASPAGATSVADVLDALTALQVLPGMDASAWQAYRIAHEADLQRAHATLAIAQVAEGTVLETAAAASLRFGHPLLCNYDEETRAGFPELAELFLAEGARRHGVDPATARPRLLQAGIEEMLPVALLARYPCPVAGP